MDLRLLELLFFPPRTAKGEAVGRLSQQRARVLGEQKLGFHLEIKVLAPPEALWCRAQESSPVTVMRRLRAEAPATDDNFLVIVADEASTYFYPGDILLAIDGASLRGCPPESALVYLLTLPLSEGVMLKLARRENRAPTLAAAAAGGSFSLDQFYDSESDALDALSCFDAATPTAKTPATRIPSSSSSSSLPVARTRSASASRPTSLLLSSSKSSSSSSLSTPRVQTAATPSINGRSQTPQQSRIRSFGGSSGTALAAELAAQKRQQTAAVRSPPSPLSHVEGNRPLHTRSRSASVAHTRTMSANGGGGVISSSPSPRGPHQAALNSPQVRGRGVSRTSSVTSTPDRSRSSGGGPTSRLPLMKSSSSATAAVPRTGQSSEALERVVAGRDPLLAAFLRQPSLLDDGDASAPSSSKAPRLVSPAPAPARPAESSANGRVDGMSARRSSSSSTTSSSAIPRPSLLAPIVSASKSSILSKPMHSPAAAARPQSLLSRSTTLLSPAAAAVARPESLLRRPSGSSSVGGSSASRSASAEPTSRIRGREGLPSQRVPSQVLKSSDGLLPSRGQDGLSHTLRGAPLTPIRSTPPPIRSSVRRGSNASSQSDSRFSNSSGGGGGSGIARSLSAARSRAAAGSQAASAASTPTSRGTSASASKGAASAPAPSASRGTSASTVKGAASAPAPSASRGTSASTVKSTSASTVKSTLPRPSLSTSAPRPSASSPPTSRPTSASTASSSIPSRGKLDSTPSRISTPQASGSRLDSTPSRLALKTPSRHSIGFGAASTASSPALSTQSTPRGAVLSARRAEGVLSARRPDSVEQQGNTNVSSAPTSGAGNGGVTGAGSGNDHRVIISVKGGRRSIHAEESSSGAIAQVTSSEATSLSSELVGNGASSPAANHVSRSSRSSSDNTGREDVPTRFNVPAPSASKFAPFASSAAAKLRGALAELELALSDLESTPR